MEEENNSGIYAKETARLWRAWRTVHEMCRDRGYELADDEVKISLDRFQREYTDITDGAPNRAKMQFSARPSAEMIKKFPIAGEEHEGAAAGTVWVEFSTETGSIGVSTVKKFLHYLQDKKFRVGILVTASPLSSQARKAMAGGLAQNISTECFLEDDLLVNITHHELVPTHVLLSKEEKSALLKRYRLKETQLPRILQKDPIARYYGLKRGDVVKIIRTSETAGRYASYRLCV